MTKDAHRRRPPDRASAREIADLRVRVAEAEETLRAIHAGEVDAVVVTGKRGTRVFTLEGADHAYRLLVESMNEGALTLAADATVLYANRRFAAMVRCPPERVMGSSFGRFVSAEDLATLQPFLTRAKKCGPKVQLSLKAADGSGVPVQIALQVPAKKAPEYPTISMIVTDMTDVRRNEALLQGLSRRLLHAQEAERARVSLELHDHITQLLCAILYRMQALADELSAHKWPMRTEAMKLRDMIGTAAEEVERISRHLRPGVLDELGLMPALRSAASEFAERTKLAVTVLVPKKAARLPADIELTLYRILQEALSNVEEHAHAGHVTVSLTQRTSLVRLAIQDDGIGFDPDHHPVRRSRKERLGLIGMRERSSHVGGILRIRSSRRAGTEVEVRIPLPPKVTPAT